MHFEMKVVGSKEYMVEALKEAIEYISEGATMGTASNPDGQHHSWIVREQPKPTPARAEEVK